jgi:hypothetical protein
LPVITSTILVAVNFVLLALAIIVKNLLLPAIRSAAIVPMGKWKILSNIQNLKKHERQWVINFENVLREIGKNAKSPDCLERHSIEWDRGAGNRSAPFWRGVLKRRE